MTSQGISPPNSEVQGITEVAADEIEGIKIVSRRGKLIQ